MMNKLADIFYEDRSGYVVFLRVRSRSGLKSDWTTLTEGTGIMVSYGGEPNYRFPGKKIQFPKGQKYILQTKKTPSNFP
jgi:hypothetical protein